jgi:hypothetical protein
MTVFTHASTRGGHGSCHAAGAGAPAAGAAPPPGAPAHWRSLVARALVGALLALTAAAAAGLWLAARVAPWQAAAAWLAAEVAFAFIWVDKLHRFSAQPREHHPVGHDGRKTAAAFLALQRFFPFSESYLQYWFRCAAAGRGRAARPTGGRAPSWAALHAPSLPARPRARAPPDPRDTPPRLIRRRNVLELLSYGLWYQTAEEVQARGDMAFLEGVVDELQRTSGVDIQVRGGQLQPGWRAASGVRMGGPA